MSVLVTLFLLFFVPFVAFIVYLALSSCLGDGIRSMRRNPSQRRPDFGREYARNISSGSGLESIEMESMMRESSAGLGVYDSN